MVVSAKPWSNKAFEVIETFEMHLKTEKLKLFFWFTDPELLWQRKGPCLFSDEERALQTAPT